MERRQASLEDSLLEVMERREAVAGPAGGAQLSRIDELQSDRCRRAAARDAALVELDQAKQRGVPTAATNWSRALDADLVTLYERQRARGGPGAGAAAGPAVRRVPDRDRPRRDGADLRGTRGRGAALPGVRCDPVADQGVRAVKVHRRGRRRLARQPGPGRLRRGGVLRRPATVLAERKRGDRRRHQQRRRVPRADRRDSRRPPSVGATEVAVSMDSKLVVEQMVGRWKVKHPDLIAAAPRGAGTGRASSSGSTTRWIPRAENSHADRLANEAMDAAARRRRRVRGRENRRDADDSTRRDGPVRAAHRPGCMLLRHGQTELSVRAPLLRPRQPGADRTRPPQADAAARVSGRARRHRGGRSLAAAARP